MSYDDAMKAAGAALDLAAAKHMDLQSAADIMGKAFMGNTSILKRYGIDLQGIQCDTLLASYVLNPTKHNHDLGEIATFHPSQMLIQRGQITPLPEVFAHDMKFLLAQSPAGTMTQGVIT